MLGRIAMTDGTVAQVDPGAERRQHIRVAVPLDGRRVDSLETPIRIFDLSEGGCFVSSLHDEPSDNTVILKIELPKEGWITVRARTLYRKPGFGFALRFIEMTDAAAKSLKKAIKRLRLQAKFAAT